MDKQVSTPQSSQIPDLVRIGSVSSDTAINVQTDILDPVIFSQSEARFVLENKGILHSNSRITFSTAGDSMAAGSGVGRSFYPGNIGVNSVIQRCALRVGTKTLCEIEDYGHFAAYESCFLPPDAVKEREQVLTGKYLTTAPGILNRSTPYASGSNVVNLSESNTAAESIKVDNGKNATLHPAVIGDYWQTIANASAQVAQGIVWDWQNEVNKPTYSILLADLFPFLKLNQLPLFMMTEQVSIHLTFAPRITDDTNASGSTRICKSNGATLATDITLTRPDCQMIADYIFYPQEMMEQYRQANANMSFQYVDYQFMKRTVANTEFQGGLIQNLGGAGRIVNKCFVMSHIELASPSNSLLNDYVAEGPTVDAAGTGQVTTNLKYNDNFLYPIDVSNNARHYHNVFSAEGRMPYIARDLYRGEGLLAASGGTVDGNTDFEGYSASTDLKQKQFFTAYRLNAGERVNSRGIELYDTRNPLAGASMFRAYLQIVKTAQLRDGIMTLQFA